MNLAHRLAKRPALHYTVSQKTYVKIREIKLILKSNNVFNMHIFFPILTNFYAEKKRNDFTNFFLFGWTFLKIFDPQCFGDRYFSQNIVKTP